MLVECGSAHDTDECFHFKHCHLERLSEMARRARLDSDRSIIAVTYRYPIIIYQAGGVSIRYTK